jgi:hypothetical protein
MLTLGGGQFLDESFRLFLCFSKIGRAIMSERKLSTTAEPEGLVLRVNLVWVVLLGILASFLMADSFGAGGSDSAPSRPALPVPSEVEGSGAEGKTKIPVIFDTDICDDIDDTWALVLLLQSPEFDVKLITTAVGNTEAKAKVVARLLEIAGRTDIPVGIGLHHHKNEHRQTLWAKDYDLSSYRGTVYRDGVQAIIDTIMKSPQPINLVAVGPLPGRAEAGVNRLAPQCIAGFSLCDGRPVTGNRINHGFHRFH